MRRWDLNTVGGSVFVSDATVSTADIQEAKGASVRDSMSYQCQAKLITSLPSLLNLLSCGDQSNQVSSHGGSGLVEE